MILKDIGPEKHAKQPKEFVLDVQLKRHLGVSGFISRCLFPDFTPFPFGSLVISIS